MAGSAICSSNVRVDYFATLDASYSSNVYSRDRAVVTVGSI